MADDKEIKQTEAAKPAESPIHGRTYNSQNPAYEKSSSRNEISSIDQQEGNMNNGECGGNLANEEKHS